MFVGCWRLFFGLVLMCIWLDSVCLRSAVGLVKHAYFGLHVLDCGRFDWFGNDVAHDVGHWLCLLTRLLTYAAVSAVSQEHGPQLLR